MEEDQWWVLDNVPYQSTMDHTPFIREEFASMAGKGQGLVLTYLLDKELLGMRIITPGLKEKREGQPRWISDYSYSNINTDYLPIAALYAMEYGQALDHLIREVMIADTSLVPVYVLKTDISNGFYCIVIQPGDDPKLGLVSLLDINGDNIVAIPPTLTMGWKNPLLYYARPRRHSRTSQTHPCASTRNLASKKPDKHTEAVVISESRTLQTVLTNLNSNPYLKRRNTNTTAYAGILADEFLGLSQGPTHRRHHFQSILF